MSSDVPLLVFGPRSSTYDFGPAHPLTPRRFGPGIDLLRHVGALPGLAPEPASDDELLTAHLPGYVAEVRRLSADPGGWASMGIGDADDPAFAGMHDAAAAVAGGSLAAMDAILAGRTLHAFHPGGGLHHALADRASGFCIYNDVALAVIRARSAGLRVLYVDLDVHHGDGVQALAYADPGTLTVSFHESGRYLFPGTGFIDELGDGPAAGTAVNVPLEPYAGDGAWLAAVRSLVPSLAAVFAPDVVVSQHGADSHAWDPLAHLRVTTGAMAEAARLVDAVAHRWADGRWLATGGGGYDAYRVVPRAWALTWLAGAHRAAPEATPAEWRARWEPEAAAFGTPGMPAAFVDAPNAGLEAGGSQRTAEERSLAVVARVRAAVLPRIVREAEDRGWWTPPMAVAAVPGPGAGARGAAGSAPAPGDGPATPSPARRPAVTSLTAAQLDSLHLAGRVVSPADPVEAMALVRTAALDGARIVAAVAGTVVVGLAVAAPSATTPSTKSLLAVGVAPGFRGDGLGRALLRTLVEQRPARTALEARIGVAERDVVDPAPVGARLAVTRRLLAGAGLEVRPTPPDVARDDPSALVAGLAAT